MVISKNDLPLTKDKILDNSKLALKNKRYKGLQHLVLNMETEDTTLITLSHKIIKEYLHLVKVNNHQIIYIHLLRTSIKMEI